MFSALYTPLLILLFALIIRGMAMEMRNKVDDAAWRAWWDRGIVAGSFVPALLFGVAFGNIFRGLPIDAAGSHVTFLGLLNPYGLLTGVLFVVMFALHGTLWAAVKTDGDLKVRALRLAGTLWWDVLTMAVAFLATTAIWTRLYDNFLASPLLFALPLAAVAALLAVKVMLARGRELAAFAASCAFVLLFTGTGVTGLFPKLIPSNLDPAFSLTIRNSSSSPYTLGIMTAVALVFVPIVIAYKTWVYRVFRARVTEADVEENLY
jgi:cytochrome d ubiquinol oxidase subunit II